MSSTKVSGDGTSHIKDEPANDIASPATLMTTPKKRGAAKASSEETPTKKLKAPTSGKKAKIPGIPTCKAEITEADRVLIEMREASKSWNDITAVFEANVGVKIGSSTCRLRYSKMKANFACVEDEHVEAMKTCVAQVEADIEEQVKTLHRKKWTQVSAAMDAAVNTKYEPGTIEKAYKTLGANGTRSASIAVAPEHEDE
ncbi:hypothetical protein BLS_009109 [Venturia inaequalis]|uniref:Myb-like domain-containing protein n=1 Tax=Venturia inaequalis TaxID=5025 RepID=A0A8H3U514_VENIN|nr:hypothetical protein BLS_009109 [Venturia inaequalis]KAE9988771.1 hypothetical protein EG328_007375 [Venturia inaequalis]